MVGHDVAAPGGEMSMIRLGDRNTSRGIPSPRTGTARGRGLNAENQSSAHLSSREKYFLLTFPLIELQGGPISLGPRKTGRRSGLGSRNREKPPTACYSSCSRYIT